MANTYWVKNGETLTDITLDGGLMYVYDGGAAVRTTVNENGVIYVDDGGKITDTVLNSGSSLYVYSGGEANNISGMKNVIMYVYAGAWLNNLTMSADSMLYIETGATLYGTNESGAFSLKYGKAVNFIIYRNGNLVVNSGDCAVNTVLKSGGTISLSANSTATGIQQLTGGIINVTVDGNGIELSGRHSDGEFSLSGGVATNFRVYRNALVQVGGNGKLLNSIIASGGAVRVASGGTVSNTVVERNGYIELAAGAFIQNITIAGSIFLAGNVTGDYSTLKFDLTSSKSSDSYILNNIGYLSQIELAAVVDSGQLSGTYQLAGGADGFTGSLSILVGGTVAGSLMVAESLSYKGYTYTLNNLNNVLSLVITAPQIPVLSATVKGAEWSEIAGAKSYTLEISGNAAFNGVLRISTVGTALDFFNFPGGKYSFRVSETNKLGYSNIKTVVMPDNTTPGIIESVPNNVDDLFFAISTEKWAANFMAVHAGSVSCPGTDDTILIAGMNRFRDVFSGSSDANILCLTDTLNGDAFFLEDIFSENGNTARLQLIDEIRAGAGNDLIDLTSTLYLSNNPGLIVRGGDGNDFIWANDDGVFLFGDAGNDSIRGGNGNDLIAGGASDDMLYGGGGSDVFTFGDEFGNDIIRQNAGSEVTLWFAEGEVIQTEQRGEDAVFIGLNGTVTVENFSVSAVKYYIGTAGQDELYKRYQELGAFAAASSTTLFSTDTKNDSSTGEMYV